MDDTAPDAGHLVDLFDQWTGGDATLRSKVFVDNPEALYRG
jgi:predicted TIM-barrel fold metal-dependent hydrolase